MEIEKVAITESEVEEVIIPNDPPTEEIYQILAEIRKELKDVKNELEEFKHSKKEKVKESAKPMSKKQKIFGIIGNITFYILLIVTVLGIAIFGSQEPDAPPRGLPGGISFLTVLTGSMEPTLPINSLVILRATDPNTLEVGDIVTYLRPNNTTVTHRIIEVIENYRGTQERGFRLQGDNNTLADSEVVLAVNVIGIIIYNNLFLGQVVLFIQQNIVLIVIYLVLLVALIYVIKKFLLGKKGNYEEVKEIESEIVESEELAEDTVLNYRLAALINMIKKFLFGKKEYLIVTIVGISAVVFGYSIYQLVLMNLNYRAIEEAIEELRLNYTEQVMMAAEREFLRIDWVGLQERNADVIAWLYVPGTNINYPVLAGATNETYLRLNIDQEFSIAGSIFLEENNNADFLDLNTIIYGHNMLNGSKFFDVNRIVSGAINQAEISYIYIYLPDGMVNIYRIIGAHLTDIYSIIYHLPVTELAFLYELILMDNVLDEIEFNKDDELRVLTLSTCTSANVVDARRSVVFAVLIDQVMVD